MEEKKYYNPAGRFYLRSVGGWRSGRTAVLHFVSFCVFSIFSVFSVDLKERERDFVLRISALISRQPPWATHSAPISSYLQYRNSYLVVVRAEVFKVTEANVRQADHDGDDENHEGEHRQWRQKPCREKRERQEWCHACQEDLHLLFVIKHGWQKNEESDISVIWWINAMTRSVNTDSESSF